MGGRGEGGVLWWSLIIQLHTCQSSDKWERGRGSGVGGGMGQKRGRGRESEWRNAAGGKEELNDREKE